MAVTVNRTHKGEPVTLISMSSGECVVIPLERAGGPDPVNSSISLLGWVFTEDGDGEMMHKDTALFIGFTSHPVKWNETASDQYLLGMTCRTNGYDFPVPEWSVIDSNRGWETLLNVHHGTGPPGLGAALQWGQISRGNVSECLLPFQFHTFFRSSPLAGAGAVGYLSINRQAWEPAAPVDGPTVSEFLQGTDYPVDPVRLGLWRYPINKQGGGGSISGEVRYAQIGWVSPQGHKFEFGYPRVWSSRPHLPGSD